jgi:tripartite-type tricarboxylate transporter receptor subunit TctC
MKRLCNGFACLFVSTLAFGLTEGAHAQSAAAYPVKPIRLVVGYAPGGPSDIVVRLVAPKVSEILGQPIVVESRGGAGGTIGMDVVVKSPADGYTLGLGASGNVLIAPHLYPKIGYNVAKDLAPVASLATTAFVVAVNPGVPAKNIAELLKLAKSRKNALTYGTSGNGSNSHIAAELFRNATGADFVHVPYKGTNPSLTAVVAGEIDMMFGDLIPALPHARSGRLRLLVNLGSQRSPAAPNVPTLAEAGVKMQPITGRYMIVAPAGTPREIVAKLHGAIAAVLKSPDTQQRFSQAGYEVVNDTPEQLGATLKSEGELIGNVIRKAGIKSDI